MGILGFSRRFWLLWAVAVIGWAGRISLPFLTLYMTQHAGFSPANAGVMLGAFGVGGVISVLLSGTLIDRLGAKPVLLITLVGTAIVCLLLGSVTSQALVGALVLLLGLFSQAMTPSYSTTLATIVRADQLRLAFSMMAIGQNVGFTVLPIIAGFLGKISFRWIYVMEGGLCAAAAILVLVGVTQVQVRPKAAQHGFWETVAGMRTVLRDKYFVVFVVQNVVFMMIYMQSQTTLPLVMDSQGFPPEQYGLLLSLNGLLVVTLQLPVDSLAGRLRRKTMLPIASLGLGLGVVFQITAVSFWLYVLCLVIWTTAELINMPVTHSEAVRLSPEGFTGRYVAVFSLSMSLATILGGMVGGVIFEVFGRTWLWVIMGVAALVLGVWRWCSYSDSR